MQYQNMNTTGRHGEFLVPPKSCPPFFRSTEFQPPKEDTMPRTSIAPRLAALALAGLAMAPSGTAFGQSREGQPEEAAVVHSWALSAGDSSQTGDRSSMLYDLLPGATTTDAVTLFNFSNVPLTFKVYATDAFNTPEGDFDLLAGDEEPTDVGTWIRLPQRDIAVPANKQVTFPITVKVPRDATPGDHVGGILASSSAQGTGPNGKIVNLDRRTGTRVYVRVKGDIAPSVSVEKVRTSYSPKLNPLDGSSEVTYRIRNNGNVRLTGKHRVSVAGPLGFLERKTKPRDLEDLLPGEEVTFTEHLSGVAASGLSFANVEVDVDPVVTEGEGIDTVSRSAVAPAVPLAVLAALAAAGLLGYSRRSYRRHQRESWSPRRSAA